MHKLTLSVHAKDVTVSISMHWHHLAVVLNCFHICVSRGFTSTILFGCFFTHSPGLFIVRTSQWWLVLFCCHQVAGLLCHEWSRSSNKEQGGWQVEKTASDWLRCYECYGNPIIWRWLEPEWPFHVGQPWTLPVQQKHLSIVIIWIVCLTEH